MMMFLIAYPTEISVNFKGTGPGRLNATTARTARRNASQYIPMFPDQICWRFRLPRGVRFLQAQPCSPENPPMETPKIRKISDEKIWKVDPRRAIFRKNHEESQFLWGFHWYFQAFAWRPQGHWGLWGGAWLQCVPWQQESPWNPIDFEFLLCDFCAYVSFVPCDYEFHLLFSMRRVFVFFSFSVGHSHSKPGIFTPCSPRLLDNFSHL